MIYTCAHPAARGRAHSTGTPGDDHIYALGVVLYQLVTGHLPIEGDSLGKTLTDAPHPAAVYRPELPAPAQAALMRALAKQPEQRFASARQFVGALVAGLSGDMATTQPTGTYLPPPTSDVHGQRGAAPQISYTPTEQASIPPGARPVSAGGAVAPRNTSRRWMPVGIAAVLALLGVALIHGMGLPGAATASASHSSKKMAFQNAKSSVPSM